MANLQLETLTNSFSKNRFICTHGFSELTALCPITRLPDFYTVQISYEPNNLLVELKSLKLYLGGYREREIIHEEITNEIFQKFIETVRPRWAKIMIEANVRGGISTVIAILWSEQNGYEVSCGQGIG